MAEKTLYDMVAGDEVTLVYGDRPANWRILKVSRSTKTLIITESGRFNKNTGRMFGATFAQFFIRPKKPDDEERRAEDQERRKLSHILGEETDWSVYSLQELHRVMSLRNSFKKTQNPE